MKHLKKLWQFMRPYHGRIWLNILFNLLSALFAIFSLLMLIPFLKILFDKTNRLLELPEHFSLWNGGFRENAELWMNVQLSRLIDQSGEQQALLMICIAVVVIFFLKNLFRYLALYVVAAVKRGVVRNIHQDFYSKIIQLPMSYFNKNKKGDLINRFTSDVLEVEYGILYFLESFLKDPITILLTLITMFAIDVRLTIMVLIALPISGLVIGFLGKTLKKESKIAQEYLSKLVTRLEETISGMRVIKSFTAQEYLATAFEEENKQHYTWSKKMLRRRDLSSPMSEFLGILVVVIILWFGGRMVFGNQIQPETFIAYIVIFSQVISPSKAFSNAYYFVQKGLASLERIQEVIETPLETTQKGKQITDFHQAIEFDNVAFGYDEQLVFENANFSIQKGDRIALVGESGAGKSTLVDLLLNLYEATKGSILIDGQNISSLDKHAWRKLVALVPQETVLFNEQLKTNILFGNGDVSEAAFRRAVELARVDVFAKQLSNGYATYIGDNGNNLSGGQRQRVAIARAFLKDAPILILDEATSALDEHNENIIAETLVALPKDMTVIIIAHRASTIQHCNKVLEIRSGKISLNEKG